MALCEQTVAIAVIGVAGSGKSTFINLASGSNLSVSNSRGSCSTTQLQSSTFPLDGRTVTLIDTPGFDGTTSSVLDVLKLISDSFSGLHSRGVKIAGVIYMHCITEDRIVGPSKHNFHIFRKFCDDTSLRDVLIVINKQSKDGPSDGEAREHDVTSKDEFFRPSIDKGARMLCHDGSQESTRAILRHLINREPTVLPSPGDSVDPKTGPPRSTADADADAVRELTGQVGHHAKAIGELCQGIDASMLVEDEGTREKLQEDAKESLEKIERIRYDLERMVTNFATENSRLKGENRRYKKDFSVQRSEAELRTLLLGEERRARELAEAKRGRAEAQLAEERAWWERQKMDKEISPGPKYDRLFVCGALIFAFYLCISVRV